MLRTPHVGGGRGPVPRFDVADGIVEDVQVVLESLEPDQAAAPEQPADLPSLVQPVGLPVQRHRPISSDKDDGQLSFKASVRPLVEVPYGVAEERVTAGGSALVRVV